MKAKFTQLFIFLLIAATILSACSAKAEEPQPPDGYINVGATYNYPFTFTVDVAPGVRGFLIRSGTIAFDNNEATHVLPNGSAVSLEIGKVHEIPLSAIDENNVLKVFIDKEGKIWIDHEPDWLPLPQPPSQRG